MGVQVVQITFLQVQAGERAPGWESEVNQEWYSNSKEPCLNQPQNPLPGAGVREWRGRGTENLLLEEQRERREGPPRRVCTLPK